MRIYVNNNADARQAVREEETFSRNARVLVLADLNRKRRLRIAANLTADNAIPNAVSDPTEIVSDVPITADYAEGTARIYNRAQKPDGLSLPDTAYADGKRKTRGALIGFDLMNGRIAGTFEQASVVQLRFAIT